jgi:hypothetical protein
MYSYFITYFVNSLGIKIVKMVTILNDVNDYKDKIKNGITHNQPSC